MKKLTKSDLKHLRQLAAGMRPCFEPDETTTSFELYGSQLIERGIHYVKERRKRKDNPNLSDEVDVAVNPKKKYHYNTKQGVPVNHYKRLKKLCEERGIAAAQNYINEVQTMGSGHRNVMSSFQERINQTRI